MERPDAYERFPLRIVLLSNLVGISIYAIGAYILAGFGIWLAMLYLVYCGWIELRVLKGSCVDCYYCVVSARVSCARCCSRRVTLRGLVRHKSLGCT